MELNQQSYPQLLLHGLNPSYYMGDHLPRPFGFREAPVGRISSMLFCSNAAIVRVPIPCR